VRDPVSRYTCLSRVIIFLWMSFLWPIGLGIAHGGTDNPVYEDIARFGLEFLVYWIALFWGTVIVEYPVLYVLIDRPASARGQLFLWVLFVNAITTPPLQFGLFTAPSASLLYAVEFAAVIVEFALLTWVFDRMYRRGVLDQPVSGTRALLASLVANLASFACGPAAGLFLVTATGTLME
jgi:hypothetical protein